MENENRYLETGSSPYYLNVNGTAKEYTISDCTNPENGFLDILSKFDFIDDSHIVEVLDFEQLKLDQSCRSTTIEFGGVIRRRTL
jgi:hypothetical protein